MSETQSTMPGPSGPKTRQQVIAEYRDVITFVMILRKLGFVEAVELLANRVGMALTDEDGRRE